MANIFDTKDTGYIRMVIEEMLRDEEKDGFVEITRNDEHFIQAKIKTRKRLYFYLHYGAFRFKGRELDVSIFNNYVDIEINGGNLDITRLDLQGFLDHVSIEVDY